VLRLGVSALRPGGTLLAVHWRHPVDDYPRSGDEVHQALAAQAGLARLVDHREPDFLAEVYIRGDGQPLSVAPGQRAGVIQAVGVVIPAHNEEDLLPSCLAAVREAVTRIGQTAVHLVVVADACTDRTAEQARRGAPWFGRSRPGASARRGGRACVRCCTGPGTSIMGVSGWRPRTRTRSSRQSGSASSSATPPVAARQLSAP
jgi:Glycosyl transferase family 2